MAYHHGALRAALLTSAVQALNESGASALSLRDLARRAGVSHAAPAHHFGDKAGLLTAIATQGFDLLTEALREVRNEGFLEVGVAYVRFALVSRAHFDVMFQPNLYRADDGELVAARDRAGAELQAGAAELSATLGSDARTVGLAGWSMAHGLASLVLSGAMPADVAENPSSAARAILASLSP